MDLGASGQKIARFGLYEADVQQRVLTKNGLRVRLQDQPFQVLALLLERPGELVTREEIQQRLWPADTYVAFDDGLNTAIKKLRLALGDTADNPRFIRTIPRAGYRFIAPVSLVPVAEKPDAGETAPLPETGALPEVASAPEPQSAEPRRGRRAVLAVALLIALVAAVVFALRRPLPPPRVVRARQLTHLGTLYLNQNLVTDGPRVYFDTLEGTDRLVHYVSADGGDVIPVKTPFGHLDVHDLSPSGTEFLAAQTDSSPRPLWRVPVNGSSARRIGDIRADDSAWTPDGKISYTQESNIYVADPDGGNTKRLAHVSGTPYGIRWSPDGKTARFNLLTDQSVTIWQMADDGGDLRPLFEGPRAANRNWAGGWTNDGKYYFFTSADEAEHVRNIWAVREQTDWWHKTEPAPVQLTYGPLSFFKPVPSRSGRSIFVLGEQRSGQLMRYDRAQGKFHPFLPNLSADMLAFSPDRQWMAYVQYPEGLLFRSRVDGSQKIQLTFPPMRAYMPHWSPNGAQIAFVANAEPGKQTAAYLVSRDGGIPQIFSKTKPVELVAVCWSPEGNPVYFSSDEGTDVVHRYVKDAKSHEMAQSSANIDARGGECSPDGRYLAGISDATHDLVLYDWKTGQKRKLAGYADYPSWSADAKYIYFNSFLQPETTRDQLSGVYRVRVEDGKVERVTDGAGLTVTGMWGVWSGITPDGSVLLLSDKSTRDVYALDLDLP